MEPELDFLVAQMRNNVDLMDVDVLAQRYRAVGFNPVTDPFSALPIDAAMSALIARTGYSLIRMGDGEMSFLCFGQTPQTPQIDRLAIRATVLSFFDRFTLTEAWMMHLHDRMHDAVRDADCLGVLGLWRANELSAQDRSALLCRRIREDIRGISGHWRGTHDMLLLAETGALDGKLLCSAHAYFGILRNLNPLIAAAQGTICITNRVDVLGPLRDANPGQDISLIALRADICPLKDMPDTPDFLDATLMQLPDDMSGKLALVGAGAWANFLCAGIKARGGVALDLGSGFDLLDGLATRPIHHQLLKTQIGSIGEFMTGPVGPETPQVR